MIENNTKAKPCNPNAPSQVRKRIASLRKKLAKKRHLDDLLRREQQLRDALRLGGW